MKRAQHEFRRFHWDEEPDALVRASAPVVTPGSVLVEIGELREVVYRTTKGGGEVTDWWHAFKDRRPVLAFNSSGRLVVVGGSYKITPRGIVG